MQEIPARLRAHEEMLIQEERKAQRKSKLQPIIAERVEQMKKNPPRYTREAIIKQKASIKSGLIDSK
jgi:hypothetical protein